ncbi:Glutamate synthase [NADPH] large chain (EC [Olavius algarvensis associated proteobacterium Delta 3]|nr:Glutamate synthase [NADPH] large chain (EC [Olavius algarvensis associated proteobacterium Delta 3]
MINTQTPESNPHRRPRGLYDPAYEHDACGVGLICDLKGRKSHNIISSGLDILLNLSHRGAVACDGATGDGAGILMQLPHDFTTKIAGDVRIQLPPEGAYASGLVFLPSESIERDQCMAHIERAVEEEGQRLLGWRNVPVNSEVIGEISRQAEPSVHQVFIGKSQDNGDVDRFERKLFIIRKLAENAVRAAGMSQGHYFHIPSLSAKTFIYKGMFLAHQLKAYYPDLQDPDMASALALVHQRYSTNTFPSWDLAHPFRFLCHNGEINTLRGNINWMNARQFLFQSDRFGEDMARLFPIATPGASDSAILDNALELLIHTGRSLPHAIMMLIPEAWQNHETMSDEKKAFYEYHSCLMEPWDGPASIAFTDGKWVGAVLDRNGLRPSRYTVTEDGLVIMGSETGVLDIDPANVLHKGRLQPGRMFLIDMEEGRIIEDAEIKEKISRRQNYRKWLDEQMIQMPPADTALFEEARSRAPLIQHQQLFGYTLEDMNILLAPMARDGGEPTGSMGDDIPPAILSRKSRLLFDYFRQLFAQVTNPPLDAIREKLVTSLETTIGEEQDLFQETPLHCRQVRIKQPILTENQMAFLRDPNRVGLKSATLPMLFPANSGGPGLEQAMAGLCEAAAQAVDGGAQILILTDTGADRENAPIPSLLATAGVHHHLIRKGLRTRCGIVVETGEAREIHHFCCLIGYGAGAVYPYLAFETLADMIARAELPDIGFEKAVTNYIKAVGKGILKVMSKMGISTLQSYRGAQIFECIGLNETVIETYFTATSSRISGADIHIIAQEIEQRFNHAYPRADIPGSQDLELGGKYKWRRDGEAHQYNPETLAKMQQAVRNNDQAAWDEFSDLVDGQNQEEGFIRGLFDFRFAETPVPLDEVEPWPEIVKRFKTGAMSYGSISKEAHETLAVAMNRIGAKSNSGEGGEDPDRYDPDPNGDWRNSAIKQVASGRFGVTGAYLANATDLQIKMAQGAKPGEGGQLPGFKVYPWIAKTRHSTPYVGLISPPPHHDIYSIEDLSQLIYDLKNANPEANINVKLVSEVGVGTVAAGVAKGRSDVILISGEAGGTGASPQTSIRYAGLPWELGLAESHQTLVMNGLRSRVVLETDGQLKTGRDLAVAFLLGADGVGFGTAALIALGCVMMRVCHLNTCPVGIATQDPELRKKFTGKPEHVITLMRFVAEDLRKLMARLGFRTVAEMVGRTDKLIKRLAVDHWKAKGIDVSNILYKAETPMAISDVCQIDSQDHGLEHALDHQLIQECRPALEHGQPVTVELPVRNVHRTVGTMLSYEISKHYTDDGLPEDTIVIHASGSAGQSFCAFGARGITIHLRGEANDYFGKGLSGARLTIRPPDGSTFAAEENIIIGNVAFYGATAGEAYIRGWAGERFCVRNSGVTAVVEGVGDHGCEYMTGGRVVVLGPTGRNFAAGMSGGIAYVLDNDGEFRRNRCNMEMVALEQLKESEDIDFLKTSIERHMGYTESSVAGKILERWDTYLRLFVKVMPVDYKRALGRLEKEHHQPVSALQSG